MQTVKALGRLYIYAALPEPSLFDIGSEEALDRWLSMRILNGQS